MTFFQASKIDTSADGIRVSSLPRPKNPEVKITAEFAPNANPDIKTSRREDSTQKKRARTLSQHKELLVRELEESCTRISSLEQELEENEFSAVEKEMKLRNILEQQERGIQLRQMHLDTALDEKQELETKLSETEKRVASVRNKALVRKFQSRFWMTLFIISLVENLYEGAVYWGVSNIVMPITTDLVFSSGKHAIGLRMVLTLACVYYFRLYKQIFRIPVLI
tara:strand:+ start:6194 stop:6865 length:672 start_codon:yes stop_codon:yes gene_type:complete